MTWQWRFLADLTGPSGSAVQQAIIDRIVPAWKANTSYTEGARVISPNGDIESAKVAFTSGATYSPANWNPSTQAGKIVDNTTRLDGRVLTADQDFRTVAENGLHKMLSFPTNWATQNMPVNVRGNLSVETFGGGRILLYKTYEAVPRIFKTALFGGIWQPWVDVDNTVALRDGTILTQNVDILTLKSGKYQVLFFPTAADNAPVLYRGYLIVKPLTADSSAKILEYVTYEATPRVFVGSTLGGGWNGWKELGAGAASTVQTAPSSGLKVVPLNVTIGGSSGTDAPLTGSFRYPMKWDAPIQRVRVCLQNVAPITGVVRTGAVAVTGIWVGKQSGTSSAFTAAPQQVQGAFSTPADGSVYKSGWFDLQQTPGVWDMLSIGYTAANGTVGQTIASGFQTAAPADASVTAPTGVTAVGAMPFFVWLEAETYATTPNVACFGDSLSSGVSAGGPMYSWLAQYCARIKALPRHHSNSGDTMQSWAGDLNAYKWKVFDGLAKPDALIWAMGSNDLFADTITLAQAQESFNTLYPVISERISPNIYLANMMPRTAAIGANETKRRDYNTWLSGLPNGARDLFNFRDAISADDETILPAYDADGVHLNAAGYAALAAAINRPITNITPEWVASAITPDPVYPGFYLIGA